MSLRAGLVGLPNVGKSTVFSALTAASVERASYPFTTIDPNVGMVPVPDDRLDQLASVFTDRPAIPAVVEIVDIAGLVRGASKGEGLGNQFLSHIRGVDALLMVVRCFDDPDVASVTGRVDPGDEIETVSLELMLADLEIVERRRRRAEQAQKTGDKAAGAEIEAAGELLEVLESGRPIRTASSSKRARKLIDEAQLLTAKPVLYVCNVAEDELAESKHAVVVREMVAPQGAPVVVICAQLEAEIAELPESEQGEYRSQVGIMEPGTAVLARETYRLLGLVSFFTTPTQIRAWQLPAGETAVEAAARIHTDFATHFIRAEVYRIPDLLDRGGEAELRAAGLMRTEGRGYVVEDGDVILFKVNV